MNNFIYENRTKVYFGPGCVKEFLVSLIKDYDTVMLAYGMGSVKKNGIYDEILGILIKSGKNVVEFSGIMPNPTYRKVMEGARLARSSGAQIILGIGGGSVMDCCKAVALVAYCREIRGRITGKEKGSFILNPFLWEWLSQRREPEANAMEQPLSPMKKKGERQDMIIRHVIPGLH